MSKTSNILRKTLHFVNQKHLICRSCYSSKRFAYKWTEIGIGQPVNPEVQIYPTGQLFLHKILFYRGIILHHWPAMVHERIQVQPDNIKKNSKTKPYYQVLVDDSSGIQTKAGHPNVSFMPPPDLRKYMTKRVPIVEYSGIDYVSHDDISPLFLSRDSKPIQHDLLEPFFIRDDLSNGPRYIKTDSLRQFQEDLYPYLHMKDVYRQTTESVRITVIPFYVGKDDKLGEHWWRYCIRIENLGEETVQLRSRHWEIFSGSGREQISDRGVVGEEPVLSKLYPVFQYQSHIHLESPTGTMWGYYTMERENGTTFQVKIPTFKLERHDREKTVLITPDNNSSSPTT
ncbi:polymerase delta-interacting protein 2-like [Dreissena polymorpha]|uniref:ApaG domain-containing protein n=1 Tax=Dreissena polymorpha TaxID=45954 RepID=A0A9D4MYB9_DREPO|nr:polymerase delta-interacting protein 2-like [Dreissena polymorpha]KAH3886177.1 hypothetical protein DPMN_010178 [Dreissena polymorpha]